MRNSLLLLILRGYKLNNDINCNLIFCTNLINGISYGISCKQLNQLQDIPPPPVSA
jgi:hypothetical protein